MPKKKQRETYQMDLFGFADNKFKITKQVKLVQFFAGVGFVKLGIEKVFPNLIDHKIVEWAIPSILAYDCVHNGELFNNHDAANGLTKEQIVSQLLTWGVSKDYNNPCSEKELNRMPIDKLVQIYCSIIHTHNLVNIMNVHGEDLEITDTDKYDYIWSWSFPCQDISGAGELRGFSESQANNENQSHNNGNGTRSGLCWEFIRILKECEQKPQILIMENVSLIHSKDNLSDWNRLLKELEDIGYVNSWQDLNGVDFGIPQHRIRTFMVSVFDPSHTHTHYSFPHPIKLEKRLCDMLEDEKDVDAKYYLSEKMLKYAISKNDKYTGNDNGAIINRTIGCTINTAPTQRRCDSSNYVSTELPNDFDLRAFVEQMKESSGGGR